MSTLSASNPVAHHTIGDMVLRYTLYPETGQVEFLPIPKGMENVCLNKKTKRPSHPSFPPDDSMFTWVCQDKDPLIQIALRGQPLPKHWSAGRTLRNGAATESLRFESQKIIRKGEGIIIETRMVSDLGFSALHRVSWISRSVGFVVETEMTNTGTSALEVEMLSSFSLQGISPFVEDDAPGRLHLHRFRSSWSNEARHSEQSFEDLHLERTWGGGPVHLKFGNAGSMPVREFHPFVAIEDRGAGVFWGAHLAWHGSWQMEVYRRDDSVALSGGLGDFDSAHWMKRLEPGESLMGPAALMTVAATKFQRFCHRLVILQDMLAEPLSQAERELPVVFNEWCSTWGNPTHDYLVRTAEKIAPLGFGYLVIDDGWAEKPAGKSIQFNGDWNVDKKAFPGGLKETVNEIRQRGLIPGIWFEFEPCTEGTKAYEMHDHQLHRHGKVLQVGNRHFWDFRDPWTFDYLTTKVIHLLKNNGFGYLKVDYNESIGLGCDGAESLGEGLRQHLIKVKEFFVKIKKAVPGIVIENCSSGGHRIEPGMVGITDMSSFSDAHETVEIPLIAAGLHLLIPVQKNQVWGVIRPKDSLQRMTYTLSALFLGRACISGDLVELDEDRLGLIESVISLYRRSVHAIRDGYSDIQGQVGRSRRYPTGWQAVVRSVEEETIVVLHSFEQTNSQEFVIQLPAPDKGWEIVGWFGGDEMGKVDGDQLKIPALPDFSGRVCLLRTIETMGA
jgi:alpha-galactosidase